MKTRYLIAALTTVGALGVTSCHKDKKQAEEGPAKIDVAEAFTDSVVLHKTYPGYLTSSTVATVVAQVDGRLLRQRYESGKYVTKGQPLFDLDPTLYKDAVERAEASLASALSTRDYAKSHYEAVKKAFQSEAVSKMEVLSAESSLATAEADIKDCRAALHTARTNLGYCTITAPVSGYITECKYDVGNYINGSGAPVEMATIYDNDTFSANFEIEDSQYEKMAGRTSGIGSPLYSDIPLQFREPLLHKYTATLSYEAPAVGTNTGTILLKGRVKNIDNELKSGMYVTVSLPYGVDPQAILIRDASIGTDQLGKYVYVVNDSNKIVYTPIEVGEVYRDSLRIVNKGLKAGDKYVTKALLTVREGEEVQPVITK
jgi:RND family efflux transporter MFP subunit